MVGGCLEALGATVTYAGRGGIARPPSDPRAGDGGLEELCLGQLVEDGHISVSTTDPQISARRYAAYLVAYQCLVALGVAPDPPIAREAFMAGDSWSPFNGLATRIDTERGTAEGPAIDCAMP